MIFGVSEPIIIAIIVAIIVFMLKVLPELQKKRSIIDYSEFNIKDSIAFWTFAGNSGPSYTNVRLSKPPICHGNGKATVWLEGYSQPLRNVNIDEGDKNCNCVIKRNADALFGTRIDVLCNIDANSVPHEWEHVFVQNWQSYRNRLKEAAKTETINESLKDKELIEELKGSLMNGNNVSVQTGLPIE